MTRFRGFASAWALLCPLALACAAAPATAQDASGPAEPPLSDFFCPDAAPSGQADKDSVEGQAAETPPPAAPGPGLACPPAPPAPPPRPPAPDLFRMIALPIGTVPSTEKWERARGDTLAGHAGAWTELLGQTTQVTGGHPLEMVNMWVNWHVRYQEDGPDDEWADALSTLQRGYGDCEDFAIAKMTLLAELGVSRDAMFLVLLRDRRNLAHAVLAVRENGALSILDNRTDRLRSGGDMTDYTPIVAYSGPFAWTYGRKLS